MSNITGRSIVEGIIDAIPYVFTVVLGIFTAVCIFALVGVDVIAGGVTSQHVWGGEWQIGAVFSLATTGLLTAAIVMLKKSKDIGKALGFDSKWAIIVLGVVVVTLILGDVYLDGLAIQVRRFGAIVDLSMQLCGGAASCPEKTAFMVQENLLRGVSIVGEPLGTMALLFFPLLKGVFRYMNGLADKGKSPAYQSGQSYRPQPQPQVARPAPQSQSQFRPAPQPNQMSPRPQVTEPTYHPVGLNPVGPKPTTPTNNAGSIPDFLSNPKYKDLNKPQ